MKKRILITGGAGFIGSHTADLLLENGYRVRILDNLSPKTHGKTWPSYLDPRIEKLKGDVRKKSDWTKSLKNVHYVIHLAAWMDLMPEFTAFTTTNIDSTALLYELIVAEKLPIKKVIVASSQFVYGEGCWHCSIHGEVFPHTREIKQLKKEKWQPTCPLCSGHITYSTNGEHHHDPPNQYSISKFTQELLSLKLGSLYDIPSVALRYSIIHGPRQSIKTAYSGALRIFALQMLQGQTPSIFEDGGQLRDYTSVYDVARAHLAVLEDDRANFHAFNVGGGQSYTVLELAEIIKSAIGPEAKDLQFHPTGEFRLGDVRHAVSDISKLKRLGWKPQDDEQKIVWEYIKWLKTQPLPKDNTAKAIKHMRRQGILQKAK
jgi:dTDP-L-rhamnose 4-epimerase